MLRLPLLLLLISTPVVLLLQIPATAMLRPAAAPSRPASFAIRCQNAENEDTSGMGPPADAAQEAADAAPEDPEKAKRKAEKQELRDAIANLEAELIKARGEAAAAQEEAKGAGESGYMLLAADFERFRMKAKDEIGAQKGYGRIAAVRSLLAFTETFEALQAERVGDDGADAIHKYYGGIWKQFQQLLDSWKVQPFSIEPGAAYDYKKIQTVESVASDDIPKDTVIEMVERGWEMDGETVRLAKCKVSSGPAVVAKEEPAAAEEAGAEEEGAQVE